MLAFAEIHWGARSWVRGIRPLFKDKSGSVAQNLQGFELSTTL
jgi:hypothetical protein